MLSALTERLARPTTVVALILFGIAGALAGIAIVVPGAVGTAAAVLLPAAGVAAAAPFLVQRFALGPQRDELRTANERVAAARKELHDERAGRATLRELDRGLDQVADEREALALIRQALTRWLVGRPAELHLVDPVDPVLDLAIATSQDSLPGARVSPWDSLAARTNTTLCYSSTDRLDVCSHIASRLLTPAAAVALPLNATGRLLGTLYIFDREGTEFSPDEVAGYEDLAGIIASRLAILRSAAPSRSADAVDRLTGLPDRSAMQERVIRLLESRQAFTVAVADVDEFGQLNRVYGREAGDRSLQLAARVARKAMRPDDIVGRIGGDEMLFILPRTTPDDATRALERLREELVLAQSIIDDPSFTLSIGVIGSSAGGTIEELLHRAAGALNYAKSQGGNRVVVAQPAPKNS